MAKKDLIELDMICGACLFFTTAVLMKAVLLLIVNKEKSVNLNHYATMVPKIITLRKKLEKIALKVVKLVPTAVVLATS